MHIDTRPSMHGKEFVNEMGVLCQAAANPYEI